MHGRKKSSGHVYFIKDIQDEDCYETCWNRLIISLLPDLMFWNMIIMGIAPLT